MKRTLFALLVLAALGCRAGQDRAEMDLKTFYDNTPLSQPTPPMGWNSYCTVNCDPTEGEILAIAECIRTNGLLAAGYRYINIDDGWMERERDGNGRLVVRKNLFPSGLRHLTDRLHEMGFLAGIYLGAGQRTWHGDAGSLGHEFGDAKQIAEWGFDYLKYDYHPTKGEPRRDIRSEYVKMGAALRASGRKIYYNLGEHGRTRPWEWAQGVGPMWRCGLDVRDCWEGSPSGVGSIMRIVDEWAEALYPYSRPGNCNDPDMLVVGMHHQNGWMGPGCTDLEYRTHMGLWCFMAAPLLIGGDPRTFNSEAYAILTNPGYLALDQDPLCVQGRRYVRRGYDGKECPAGRGYEIWRRTLSGMRWAVALFNREEEPHEIGFSWEDVDLVADWAVEVTDVWSGEKLAYVEPRDPGETVFKTLVQPHEFRIVIVEPKFVESTR